MEEVGSWRPTGRASTLGRRRGARRRNPAWAHGCLRQCSHQPARQQKEAAIVASTFRSVPRRPPCAAVSASNDRPTDEMPDELTALFAAVQAIYEMTVALRDGDEMTFKIAFKNRRGKLVSHVKLEIDDRVRAYLRPIAEAEADTERPS